MKADINPDVIAFMGCIVELAFVGCKEGWIGVQKSK